MPNQAGAPTFTSVPAKTIPHNQLRPLMQKAVTLRAPADPTAETGRSEGAGSAVASLRFGLRGTGLFGRAVYRGVAARVSRSRIACHSSVSGGSSTRMRDRSSASSSCNTA